MRAPTYPGSDRIVAEHQTPQNPPLAPAPAPVSSPTYQPIHQLPEITTERRSVPYPSEPEHIKLGLIETPQHTRLPNAIQISTGPQSQRGGQNDEIRRLHPRIASGSHDQGRLHMPDEPHLNISSFGSTQQPHNLSNNRISSVSDNNSSFRGQDLIDEHVENSSFQDQKSCCCSTSAERTPSVGPAVLSSTNIFPLQGENTRSLEYQPPDMMQINKFPERRKIQNDTPFPQDVISFHTPPVPHTTIYSMPATYATAENPLTQRQQAYFQQNGQFYTQNVPHYAPLGVVGSAAPSAENAILSLTHNCTCGPSCQCVFCAAHPYNATTRDRVQTLAHLLPDDTDYTSKSPIQSPYRSSFQTSAESSPIVSATNRMHINEILHPSDLSQSTPFSSPDFDGEIYQQLPTGTQPPISSSAYLTMEYEYGPIGLGRCTDPTGTCRCGDDCSCIGCLTHSGHEEWFHLFWQVSNMV